MTNSIVDKKYLSILVDRFFSRYQHEEQPNFVEFVKLWFKHAEQSYMDDDGITHFSFWKTLGELDNFIDVDKVPNELLRTFITQYANNFDKLIENIPFFVEYETDPGGFKTQVRDEYGNIVYKYNNIRMFLKTSKKFFSSKGSYYAIMYMFRIFGGSLEIVPVKEDIITLSNPNCVLSAPNSKGRMAHLHGIHPNPYTTRPETHKLDSNGVMKPKLDWWYSHYTYEIRTNLEEDFYKPLLLEVAHPAGMKCIWKVVPDTSLLDGWGYDDWGTDGWGSVFTLSDKSLISLNTNDIQFNNTSKNGESVWRDVEITNTGEQPLIIDEIILLEDVSFEIDLEDAITYPPIGPTYPISINYGQTVGFKIRFTPKLIGNWSTRIIINSNSHESEVRNILLSGYCVL